MSYFFNSMKELGLKLKESYVFAFMPVRWYYGIYLQRGDIVNSIFWLAPVLIMNAVTLVIGATYAAFSIITTGILGGAWSLFLDCGNLADKMSRKLSESHKNEPVGSRRRNGSTTMHVSKVIGSHDENVVNSSRSSVSSIPKIRRINSSTSLSLSKQDIGKSTIDHETATNMMRSNRK